MDQDQVMKIYLAMEEVAKAQTELDKAKNQLNLTKALFPTLSVKKEENLKQQQEHQHHEDNS